MNFYLLPATLDISLIPHTLYIHGFKWLQTLYHFVLDHIVHLIKVTNSTKPLTT